MISADLGPQGIEQLFEDLYDPAFLIDPEGGAFVGVNAAACRLLGYQPAELHGLTPADIHPHEIPRLDAFLEAVIRERRWATDELSCRAKQGTLIPAQVRASVVVISDRRYIFSILRDRREAQLADLGRSLRKLAHDLRNTMVASRLMGSRLSRHDDPLVQRSAELITRSVDRAVLMCERVLEVGSATESAPRRERFTLAELLAEIGTAIGPEEFSGASLEPRGAEVTVLVADFDQVFRILLNLIRNALQAGAGRIEVAGANVQGEALVDVSDDGPGLPETVQRRLFEEQPGAAGNGRGLGLPIAWELARNNGGDIVLLDSSASGTAFRLTLPAEVDATRGEASESGSAVCPGGG